MATSKKDSADKAPAQVDETSTTQTAIPPQPVVAARFGIT